MVKLIIEDKAPYVEKSAVVRVSKENYGRLLKISGATSKPVKDILDECVVFALEHMELRHGNPSETLPEQP